jgi:hypothetical protein
MTELNDKFLPLTLRAKESLGANKSEEWLELKSNGFEKLLKTIEMPPLSEGASLEISQIISGLPDPWARPLLYKYALTLLREQDNITTGIYPFFKYLGEEWKALMTLLALYRDKLKVSGPMSLEGSTLKSLLSDMLFEEKGYWATGNGEVPFLQLIEDNNGTLIGATSPFTLVFKAANFDFGASYPWFKNGVFMVEGLSPEEKTRLYLFLQHIKKQWEAFAAFFVPYPGIKPCHRGILDFLQLWENDLLKGAAFPKEGLMGDYEQFHGPFGAVFNTSSKVGVFPGLIFTYNLQQEGLYYQVNASDIFLPPGTAIPEIVLKEEDLPKVYFLKAKDEFGSIRFFALPISKLGITIFQDKLKDLLSNEWDHQIRGTVKKDVLEITLTLTIDNKKQLLPPVEYKVHPDTSLNRKAAIVWPNFRSDAWKNYFFYSEKPHNNSGGLNFRPLQFKKNNQTHKHPDLVDGLEEKLAKVFIHTPKELLGKKVEYEIFQSEIPFSGIEIRDRDEPVGFLILNPDATKFIQRDSATMGNFRKARVGIDFGSTNTRVSFSVGTEKPTVVEFSNRRVFLSGVEVHDPEFKFNALPHEVFFFQNEQPKGMVKTMIMRHNEQRVSPQFRNEPGASGFPVFERNVTVVESRQDELVVDFGDTQKESIKWNLKWQDLDTALAYKKSFLQILWLKVWAELFEKGIRPHELVWSYPQVMRNQGSLLNDYALLWNEVLDKSPVPDAERTQVSHMDEETLRTLTESEAVCMYALSLGNLNPTPDTVAVGFDVGGSTTDILVIVQSTEGNKQYTLFKQSSVKIAANILAQMATRSPKVQQAIKEFAKEQDIYIYGMDTISTKTADHLFNTLLDRVNDRGMEDKLYRYLWTPTDNTLKIRTRMLFALTGYVSGLLMFYVGQLIGAEKDKLGGISQIRAGFYGNGGKIFDWLVNARGGRSDFYLKCLQAGANLYEKSGLSLSLGNGAQKTATQSRNEVSLGLAATHFLQVEMPYNYQVTDIVGEEGYIFNNRPIDKGDLLQAEYLVTLQQKFLVPSTFPVLNTYLGLYLDEMQTLGLVNNKQPTLAKVNRNDYMNFVQNHPDFISAQRNLMHGGHDKDKFNFIISPFLLEGMYVFEKILMPDFFPDND